MVAAASLLIWLPWASAQDSVAGGKITRPGVQEFQVPFTSLKPDATFKIGTDADWVQITDDAVWVASSEPASVHRIDPKTNKEVAGELNISPYTVETHRAHILEKLNLHNSAELVLYAVRKGIIH